MPALDGQVATTEVDQVFRNPLPQRLEGTYMFPLPEDAAVDQFSMWIDGKEMQGELLDAGKALKIYTDIVRSMKDPALLEYAGRGMFKVRIFPIEVQELRNDQVGCIISHRTAQKDNSISQQPRIDVIAAFASTCLLNNDWNQLRHVIRSDRLL